VLLFIETRWVWILTPSKDRIMFSSPRWRQLSLILFIGLPLLLFLGGLGIVMLGIAPLADILRNRLATFLLNALLALFWLIGGLFFAAQFLFPLTTLRSRFMAFKCLFAWYMGQHQSSYVLQDGKAEERIRGSRFYGIAGVVLVDSNTAAVLDDGMHYTRVIGPNMIQPRWLQKSLPSARSSAFFLGEYERIRGVVDLRRQVRSQRVEAVTRDGIQVTCELYTDFEIERPVADSAEKIAYAFDAQAVYHAVYGQGIKKEEHRTTETETDVDAPCVASEEEYQWTDAVITEGAEELRNTLAEYTLDQLYAADDPDRQPLIEIEQRMFPVLGKRLHGKGARLLRVTLGVLHAPTEVVAQKVKSWQADWERRQMIVLAQGESESRRRHEIARALAQLEMISSITQALSNGNAEFSKDIVTLRMIQALEQMTVQSSEREQALLPQTRESLGVLRQTLASLNSNNSVEGRNGG
jgi:regulator of protease activity HflC (stomatin/prohibitin superfamily)